MKAHGTRRCSVRFLVFYSCFLVVTTKAICDVALEKEEKHSSNEHNETKVNLSNSQSRIAFRILYKPFSKKKKAKQKTSRFAPQKGFFPLEKRKKPLENCFLLGFKPISAVQQILLRRAADCKERPATHQTQREERKSGRKRENPEKEGKNMQKVKNLTINPAYSKRNRPFLASYSHFYPLNELPKGQKRHIFTCKRKNVKSEIRTKI